MSQQRNSFIFSLLYLVVILAGASQVQATSSLDVLVDRPVVLQKKAGPIATSLTSRMQKSDSYPMTVWVFFTDKEVFDQSGFDRAATNVHLTERALNRRKKVGRDRPLFVDLPVSGKYIETIEQLGCKHLRSSRWQNAATFDVTAGQLQVIAELPFVYEIRPMRTLVGKLPEPLTGDESETAPSNKSPQALNYGVSINQLTQINVPAAHDSGYTGAGVTLAIMDTGFRKSHTSFAQHWANNRVLGEWDFVQNDSNTANETGDNGTQQNHGTYVWSTAAGEASGNLYGPAYQANIILCKTENVASETQVEEHNWVAAVEFADSIGTDVITTSLGYLNFDGTAEDYTFADLDGETTIITQQASLCDGLGIVLCNSMGNSGPGTSTLTAPADAFDILAVGAVNASGTLASFSSRGPTADGRAKPEVLAMGVATHCASPFTDTDYNNINGTSLSTPLVAGAVCLVIEAHPDWTPRQVREALKLTASLANDYGVNAAIDNSYGYGIIDVMAAINSSPPCCFGQVGNVNGLGGEEPNLSDIVSIIDYLFITGVGVDCLAEADVNLSGGGNPTHDDISIADVATLIEHLFITQPDLADCP